MNDFSVTISILQMLLGIYIHFKKMNVAKMKKDITWELEIYHSMTCVIYFTWATIIDIVKYTCPEIDQSIESIMHQTVWILRTVGITIINCHSLNVALYKYYIIVDKRPISAEDKQIKLKYLLALILYPIIVALCILLQTTDRTYFMGRIARFCYSEEEYRKSTKSMKELLLCRFDDDDAYRHEWPIIYVWSEVYCVLSKIITVSLYCNILEIFVYFKIFTFSKR